nr:hybrid signal transduction histidine kinase M [Tanacetum cinerariifolium]
MADDDITTPPTTNEKPFGITNIKTYIPLVLDLDELNYNSWSEIFTLHYGSLSRYKARLVANGRSQQ